MNKYALLAILPLLAMGGSAQADLEYVGESNDGNVVFSYRTDRMGRDGPYITAWVYSNTKKLLELRFPKGPPRLYASTVSNWTILCSAGTFGTGDTTYYGTEGNLVYTWPSSPYVQTKAIPDSVADSLVRAICRKVGQATP